MDEAKVGGLIKRCSKCDEYGHKAKEYPHSNHGDAGEQDHPPVVDVRELHVEDKQCTGLGQTLPDMLFRNNMFLYLFG